MKVRILLSLFSLLLLTQCGIARTTDESRDKNGTTIINPNLPAFDAISASSGWNIVVRQGAKQSIRLEVADKYADRIKVEVRAGKLRLGMERSRFGNFSISGNAPLNAYITVTDLKSIDCSGGVDMTFKTPIRHSGDFAVDMSGGADLEDLKLYCSELHVDASGGSDTEIELMSGANVYVDASGGADVDIAGIDSRECKADVSGGSDVTLSGRARMLSASCSGGADLMASKLESADCNISCSGAGTAYVYATESLDAKASGASDIYYYGNPKNVSRDTSSSSSIKKR